MTTSQISPTQNPASERVPSLVLSGVTDLCQSSIRGSATPETSMVLVSAHLVAALVDCVSVMSAGLRVGASVTDYQAACGLATAGVRVPRDVHVAFWGLPMARDPAEVAPPLAPTASPLVEDQHLDPIAVVDSTPRGEAGYLALLRRVLDGGERRTDRTGTGTMSVFGAQLRFDLREGFPLLTTKKVNFAPVVKELLWFLRGATNVRDGLDCKIWDEWADDNGDLGPIYGHQWRNWGGSPAGWPKGIDQISEAIRLLKTSPDSRRIVVSAWNVADLPAMKLAPCHCLFQFYATGDGHLDLQLYQRSADLALGVPFNIASYALLLTLVATECGLTPRYFVHTFGDAHVYLNHVAGIREQLTRAPRALPRLLLRGKSACVLDQTYADVCLEGYDPHPAIKFEVSV